MTSNNDKNSENLPELTKNLNGVFTIDGRGRGKKIKLLKKLINKYGIDFILNEMSIIENTTNL